MIDMFECERPVPELEEADSEDVFEYLMENGFGVGEGDGADAG